MKQPKRWMTTRGIYTLIVNMEDKHIENAMKDLKKGIQSDTIPRKYNYALSQVRQPITNVARFKNWARNRLTAFRKEQRDRGLQVTVSMVR